MWNFGIFCEKEGGRNAETDRQTHTYVFVASLLYSLSLSWPLQRPTDWLTECLSFCLSLCQSVCLMFIFVVKIYNWGYVCHAKNNNNKNNQKREIREEVPKLPYSLCARVCVCVRVIVNVCAAYFVPPKLKSEHVDVFAFVIVIVVVDSWYLLQLLLLLLLPCLSAVGKRSRGVKLQLEFLVMPKKTTMAYPNPFSVILGGSPVETFIFIFPLPAAFAF